MQSDFDDTTFESLLVEALRRTRCFVNMAREVSPGAPSERGTLSRCLADLESGRILGQRGDSAVAALHTIVVRELERETEGFILAFDGYFDPEFGDVGSVRRVARRTDRGEELADLQKALRILMDAREAARDRFRAEQELRALL